jgi:putative hydrolase of the HAD superfamily
LTSGLRFVLFDLYETMVTFDHASVRAAREAVLKPCGVPVDELERAEKRLLWDRMLGRCGDTLQEETAAVLRSAGAPGDARFVAAFIEAELRAWRGATHVHRDVMPCLAMLRCAGYGLGLISNCVGLTRELLPAWPFGAYFGVVVLSCEVGLSKPDPAILRRAAAEAGCRPEECALVDDLAPNVDAAREAGLQAWHVARGTAGGGPGVISGLGELADRLVRLQVAGAATR